MPLFFQRNINAFTRLAIWKIEEDLSFFQEQVPEKTNITHPQKKLQHLAGRYLLPYLFSDFPNREIVIADTNKPYLPHEQYHFSISHCGDYAAAIVSRTQRVGIDIEIYSDKVQKVENKFLSPQELDLIRQADGTTNLPMLTAFWSTKEAIYKWWSYRQLALKANMHIHEVDPALQIIHADFIKGDIFFPLQLEYHLFEKLSLCWIAS